MEDIEFKQKKKMGIATKLTLDFRNTIFLGMYIYLKM